MSRLTFKVNDAYYVKEPRHLYEDTWELVQELGKLEDIEDELGCPLDVAFKALKSSFGGVKYKVEDEIIEGSLDNIYHSIGGYWMGEFCPRGYILGTREQYTKTLHLKDYGKTWWLSSDLEE